MAKANDDDDYHGAVRIRAVRHTEKTANPQIRSNAHNIYTDRLHINGHNTFTKTAHARKIGSRPKISLNSIENCANFRQTVPHKSVLKHFLQIETNTDDDYDRTANTSQKKIPDIDDNMAAFNGYFYMHSALWQ